MKIQNNDSFAGAGPSRQKPNLTKRKRFDFSLKSTPIQQKKAKNLPVLICIIVPSFPK